tara:strand:- start:324 stop:1265 length:942 start_codon:yes stop_codon:yes gene_type:complete
MKTKEASIGVLLGGPSAEREISLKSGQAVFEALQKQGYQVQALDITDENPKTQITQSGIEMAFIALHGPFGEDGTIQSLLESLEIPYTGSGPEASKLCMDKCAARLKLEEANLPVPEGLRLTGPKGQTGVLPKKMKFPLVIKPCRQGSSIGMNIVEQASELETAFSEALRYDSHVLCEAYLKGAEVTVGVVGDQALPVVEVRPTRKFYDYTAKYTAGMTEYLVPAPLDASVTKEVQRLGVAAHQALGCHGFSRVDFIVSEEQGPKILEVNTIPGLTKLSLLPKAAQAVGLSFSDLCEKLLASSQKRKVVHGAA